MLLTCMVRAPLAQVACLVTNVDAGIVEKEDGIPSHVKWTIS